MVDAQVEPENGRVKQAERLVRIEEKIDRLLEGQAESRGDRKDLHTECETITKHITETDKDVLRLQERMSTLSRWTVGLGIFSPTLAGFLAWVASQFGLGK